MDLIADTSYLVGIWRGQPWAKRHAQAHADRVIGLPRGGIQQAVEIHWTGWTPAPQF